MPTYFFVCESDAYTIVALVAAFSSKVANRLLVEHFDNACFEVDDNFTIDYERLDHVIYSQEREQVVFAKIVVKV